MMHHQTFAKPMSADYARFVVTTANNSQNAACSTSATAESKRRSRSFSLFKSRRHDSVSMDLRATTVSTATSVATVTLDGNNERDSEDDNNNSNNKTDSASVLRKKVWWRQLVLSQSLPAMLNAQTRR